MNKIPKKILFSLPKFSDLRGSLSLMRCNTIKKGTKNVPDFFTKNPDQIFISETKPWHGRGLHYQKKNPLLQTVTVISGKIEECLVEIVQTEKGVEYITYKGSISSEDDFNSFIVPKGWAHGFYTKSNKATIIYQVWGERSINDEHGYNLTDSKFGFLKNIELNKIKLNERDESFNCISDHKI